MENENYSTVSDDGMLFATADVEKSSKSHEVKWENAAAASPAPQRHVM